MLPGRKAEHSDVLALPATPSPAWQGPPVPPVLHGGCRLHQEGMGMPNTAFAG